jgi:hypothetical protein
MNFVEPSRPLKTALAVDALVSAATAALQLTMPGLLAERLGLPYSLLLETGVFMVAYVVLLVGTVRSARVPAALVWAIVLGNAVWAAGCVVVWASGVFAPTALGTGFLVLQAVTVLALAAWQGAALRRCRPVSTANVAPVH